MSNDILEGKWHQVKGGVREKWGELTNDDVEQVDGSFERLVGTIQERYGKARAEVEQEVNDWLEK